MCEFITLKIQQERHSRYKDNNQLNLKFIDCIQIDLTFKIFLQIILIRTKERKDSEIKRSRESLENEGGGEEALVESNPALYYDVIPCYILKYMHATRGQHIWIVFDDSERTKCLIMMI